MKIIKFYFEDCLCSIHSFLFKINFRIIYMFSFHRKKLIQENEESMHEIEDIVQTLHKDGNGRIRIKDLENALQRMDEDIRSKPERTTQVRKFSE